MFFNDSIYVQIYQDRFIIRNMNSGASTLIQRNQEFASPRMLIADFTTAEYQLKQGVKEMRRGLLPPNILMHPMELIEGGLTQVEYRVLRELALGATARKVGIWNGVALGDVEAVKNAIRDDKG